MPGGQIPSDVMVIQGDEDIETTPCEVHMSWCMIALSDLESILVPEAVLCGHWGDSMETISKGQAWCGRTG